MHPWWLDQPINQSHSLGIEPVIQVNTVVGTPVVGSFIQRCHVLKVWREESVDQLDLSRRFQRHLVRNFSRVLHPPAVVESLVGVVPEMEDKLISSTTTHHTRIELLRHKDARRQKSQCHRLYQRSRNPAWGLARNMALQILLPLNSTPSVTSDWRRSSSDLNTSWSMSR